MSGCPEASSKFLYKKKLQKSLCCFRRFTLTNQPLWNLISQKTSLIYLVILINKGIKFWKTKREKKIAFLQIGKKTLQVLIKIQLLYNSFKISSFYFHVEKTITPLYLQRLSKYSISRTHTK